MDSATLAQPQREFKVFPKLPIELRRLIWRATFPGPRLVRIRFNLASETFSSPTKFPIALGICSESRRETMRFYMRLFSSKVAIDYPRDERARIWFNPSVDVAFLSDYTDIGLSCYAVDAFPRLVHFAEDLEIVKYIAVAESHLRYANIIFSDNLDCTHLTRIVTAYSLVIKLGELVESGEFGELSIVADADRVPSIQKYLREVREGTGLHWLSAVYKP